MSCKICEKMLHTLFKAESSSDSLVFANSTYQRLSAFFFPKAISTAELIWTRLVLTILVLFGPRYAPLSTMLQGLHLLIWRMLLPPPLSLQYKEAIEGIAQAHLASPVYSPRGEQIRLEDAQESH